MSDKSKKSLLLITIIICWALDISAQVDSVKTIVLNSVYITEKKPTFSTTSREVIALTNTEMKEKRAQTLSEQLSTIPGVSQITTGSISKPVIRGLNCDRIQINVAGVKLEDQQWFPIPVLLYITLTWLTLCNVNILNLKTGYWQIYPAYK